jgi:hypothetical protein
MDLTKDYIHPKRHDIQIRLQSMVGTRKTETQINDVLSQLCETKMTCFYAEEQNALDHTFYFQRFDGKYDLDGTFYALPQLAEHNGEKVWYITEICLD